MVNSAFAAHSLLSGSIGGVMPATIRSLIWFQPSVLSLVVALVGAVGIALIYGAIAYLASRVGSRSASFIIAWFAAVAAGVVVGLASDIATMVASLPAPRLQWILNGLGAQAAVGGYWGFVQGWIPALLGMFLARQPHAENSPVDSTERWSKAVVAGAVAIALVIVASINVASERIARIEATQTDAIANGFDESSGALPDPYANGTPVATAAPRELPRDDKWCDEKQAMLILGGSDAATGHRTLAIEWMNFSDAPCIAEGYLDIAFADQNGNALDVDVVHGGSFLTTDPGPQPIEIPAGESAIAHLGWNASATSGALVATTVYAAPVAGDIRGSWPAETDIVEGSTVNVTAWELRPPISTGTP
jgi:hypothetical protein